MKVEYELQYFATGFWFAGSFWESKPDALAHYAAMVRRFPKTEYRLIERRISEFIIGLDGTASPLPEPPQLVDDDPYRRPHD